MANATDDRHEHPVRGLSELEEKLMRRREQLVERFDSERKQSKDRPTDEAMDEADRGRQELDVSFLDQLSERDQRALKEIDAALERIETGEYGLCAECGEPIGRRRLWAMPEARLCVGCASLRENETEPDRLPSM